MVATSIWFMAVLAVLRLGYELWRLLLDPGVNGAIDLRIFHNWVKLWFEGAPLNNYNLLPATYPLLWPLTGWLPFEPARWLWLVLYIASIAWLIYIVKSESGLTRRREPLFAIFFILAAYPTAITIGNGQLVLFLLPAILTAVLTGRDGGWTPGKEAAVSLLLLFSTLKIPVAAPFFLITLVTQRGYRPIIFTAAGYILLSILAVSFRDSGLIQNLGLWIRDASALATEGGYANIHIWLGYLSLGDWILPASLALLLAFGLWLYLNRAADVWVQLGIAAIVARMWTYHRLYDDLLIIVPAIALFRILRYGDLSHTERAIAFVILVAVCLGLLAPGSFLQLAPPLGTLFRAGQTAVWLSALVFLLYYAHRSVKKVSVRSGR